MGIGEDLSKSYLGNSLTGTTVSQTSNGGGFGKKSRVFCGSKAGNRDFQHQSFRDIPETANRGLRFAVSPLPLKVSSILNFSKPFLFCTLLPLLSNQISST